MQHLLKHLKYKTIFIRKGRETRMQEIWLNLSENYQVCGSEDFLHPSVFLAVTKTNELLCLLWKVPRDYLTTIPVTSCHVTLYFLMHKPREKGG